MKKALFISLTALGISSIIAQLIVMREFANLFSGNELIYGIILGNWLLLTGVGSFLGKYLHKLRNKKGVLIICQLLIAVLPFVHVLLIRYLRSLFPGIMFGIRDVYVFSFLLMIPYCAISGGLLTFACVVFSKYFTVGEVYFIDTIGDILGGLLFSFILVYFLNSFQISFIIFLINGLAALMLAYLFKRKALMILSILISLLSFFVLGFNLYSLRWMYNEEIIFEKNTAYGHIVVTQGNEQLNFYENGVVLFSTENAAANEEAVHYAMLQTSASNVLLISGGISGTVDEILRYDVASIDYIELDPLLFALGKEFTNNLDSTKVNLINGDGRLFVRKTDKKYDVVIVDLPDPSNVQLNRFYTDEFFKEIRCKLSEKGVISLSLSGYENYIDKETKKIYSVLYETLKANFKRVIVIPGDRTFFIASNNELSYDVIGLLKQKNISNKYVNEYYLESKLGKERIDYLRGNLDYSANINKDFFPISYYNNLLRWLSQFKTSIGVLVVFLTIVLLYFILRLRAISFAIFTTGFAASSLEVVLIIGFQILYGYVYSFIGVIITAFMLGLAIGSYYINKTIKKRKFNDLINIELLIIVFSLLLPLILMKSFSAYLIPILTLILAILVGMEFPLASKFFKKKVHETASSLYNADLIGACIGAFVVSALLIPLIGVVWVCVLVGTVNIISLVVLVIKRNI
ncbi:hypothetical protein JW930_04045 [Candidatus Woesearchaeota archaeon]|nr:hypothetical protein [Candidatus Woesearchaeota archaeon]